MPKKNGNVAATLGASSNPTRGSEAVLLIAFAVSCLVVTSLILRICFRQEQFADYSSYVGLAEELYWVGANDLGWFELFSRGMLYLLSELSRDSVASVDTAYRINLLLFIAGFGFLVIRFASNWRNVVLVGAMYSPLLVFVTLRATPAYLLVFYAFFVRDRYPRMAVAACIMGMGFHISAMLALIPLLLTSGAFGSRVLCVKWQSLDFLIVSAGLLVYLLMGSMADLLAVLTAFLGEQGPLAKFAVYVAAEAEARSVLHKLYFLVAFGIVCTLLLNKDEVGAINIRYITLSFLLYSILSVSPVVAFRQSIFWMVPAMLLLPLRKLSRLPAVAWSFLFACFVLYGINFYGVLV